MLSLFSDFEDGGSSSETSVKYYQAAWHHIYYITIPNACVVNWL
jgi:hypothetical protein